MAVWIRMNVCLERFRFIANHRSELLGSRLLGLRQVLAWISAKMQNRLQVRLLAPEDSHRAGERARAATDIMRQTELWVLSLARACLAL